MSCNFVEEGRDVGDSISKKQINNNFTKNFSIISNRIIANKKKEEKKNLTSKSKENSLTVKKDSLNSKIHLKINENSLKSKETDLKYNYKKEEEKNLITNEKEAWKLDLNWTKNLKRFSKLESLKVFSNLEERLRI